MVPMFKDADEDFLSAIVSMFTYEVFLEGDLIINTHTRGSTMYFIQHGEAQVINRNGQVVRVLVDGDYFGGKPIVHTITCLVATVEPPIQRENLSTKDKPKFYGIYNL